MPHFLSRVIWKISPGNRKNVDYGHKICYIFSTIARFFTPDSFSRQPNLEVTCMWINKFKKILFLVTISIANEGYAMTSSSTNSEIVHLEKQIEMLLPIQERCEKMKSVEEKFRYISQQPAVIQFFQQNKALEEAMRGMPVAHQYVIKVVIALGQGPVIFANWQQIKDPKAALNQLVEVLYDTERFYDYMGGIPGYHVKTLQLIHDQLAKQAESDPAKILPPPATDVRTPNPFVNQLIVEGIQSIGTMCEFYAVGGAGDRLQLIDEKTNMPLPVARLEFAGYTLLEQLIRDLEAREYLHYKLTGKQHYTPVVLMTSNEKNNDAHIASICEERGYFGRPKTSIFRLLQPLAPVLTVEGTWAVSAPCELVLKPGGHGVIWKLADQYGAFDWLQKQQRAYCLVRQINNPLAGLDYNLLVLAGYGYTSKKAFGFESIPRLPNMSEGMNVLKEVQANGNVNCCISNLEYTEFAKKKQHDPEFAKIADSLDFPANTNILFADLGQVKKATKELPVPGFLVNMKHPVDTLKQGQKVTMPGARLESTMQNIADVITTQYKMPLEKEQLKSLDTFVLLNERTKTMSVTKKASDGKSIVETPEGCFYDLMQQNMALLKEVCQFEVPLKNSPEEYLKQGPNALFIYHPALGPLYSVIGQKISKGKLHENAELQIEAAEVSIKNLDLDGSLLIVAENATGRKNPSTGLLEFSQEVGHIVLENVQVENKGIKRDVKNSYFKNKIQRQEAMKIVLQGFSELVAKNVRFTGNVEIVVPDGQRATVTQATNGKLQIAFSPLKKPESLRYAIEKNNQIVVTK